MYSFNATLCTVDYRLTPKQNICMHIYAYS